MNFNKEFMKPVPNYEEKIKNGELILYDETEKIENIQFITMVSTRRWMNNKGVIYKLNGYYDMNDGFYLVFDDYKWNGEFFSNVSQVDDNWEIIENKEYDLRPIYAHTEGNEECEYILVGFDIH